MKTYEAYCAICDANVRVTLNPTAEHPLRDAELECLDRCPSCSEVVCPLEGATARELAERLEFLPSRAREGVEPMLSPDSEEAIEQGRIHAMRRGNDPVR